VDEACNGTDSTDAVKAPLPYYIPEATISVSSMGTCAAVAATNPVFTSKSRSGASGTTTQEGGATSTAESESESGGASIGGSESRSESSVLV
jgi:hypothetical protein